jgi:hypothetical protein
MNRSLTGILFALLLTASLPAAEDIRDDWPRTLPVGDGLMTIYPLQVDGLEEDVLSYRAALAWRPTAESEPVFGAGWFESRVVVDQDSRVVYSRDLEVTKVRFPEGTAYVYSEFAAALAEQAPGWNLDVSLDELKGGLRTAEAEQAAVRELNTAPPRIVYRDRPAVLVTLDGEPVMRDIEDTPYKAVVNTPYPLISDGRHFYLNAAKDVWYRADDATGPYRFEATPPADLAAMVKPDASAEAVETPAEPVSAANAPEIVVATEPTELIVTDGPAAFVPLVDELLVLQNSDDDVFMHVASQQYYIVLAGRWYRADSLSGPWSYQAADGLPAAFAEIPPDSAQADSRAFVAGTPEAEDAVLDAQIPETRAVARGPADVEVEYDGEPSFAPVDGTEMTYAANTGATVLASDRRYYLVEDGVWYESATPNGPWEVATRRPDGVESIAPTSPVYNTKYVYIYGSTPNVVYVGYTPGYLGSYVYYDTVVYGTGWYYRPWVSPAYYYPRPRTWGFHVTYDSWYGWNFGFSWNWGWGWRPYYGGYYSGGYWHHNHHWHHPHRGYWRPRGHRPAPAPYAHHGYHGDRYRRDSYRGDRGGRRGSQRINDTGPYRADLRTARSDRPRDAGVADGSKVRGHRTEPVNASALRRKAQVRDASAVAARDMPVAGQAKIRRHRTEPVNASDLRRKAQVRDASAVAARDVPVAGQPKTRRHRTEPVDASDLRRKAQVRDASAVAARDVPVAGQPKTRRHRTEPVNASDLRRKAQVRDTSAAAARNVLVADSRGDLRPAAAKSRGLPAKPAPASPPKKATRSWTAPVRVDPPQRLERELRQPAKTSIPRRRPESDAAPTARRAPSASASPAMPTAERNAARNQRTPTRPGAANPGSPPPEARRDEARREPASPVRSPPSALVTGRGQPAPTPGPRSTASRPPVAATPPHAPAQRGGPGDGNRSAAPAPQRQDSRQSPGRGGPGGHEGPGRTRKDRANME